MWYTTAMHKKTLFVVGAVAVVAVGVWAELYYFRFHTYFQRTEVQETLPPMPSGQAQTQPRTVVSGSFVEVDAVHKGSGTARIVEQGGVRYLRLEDFEVTNGPDLFVYLSESTTPGNSLESIDRYINLGPLKGSAGNQTYEIPETLRGYDTAVIWCQKFGVLFSYAVMR
jgi:hypothetical protein